MPSELLTYKQKPILKLTSTEDKFANIQFGLRKALLILQELPAINEFVIKNQNKDTVTADSAQEVK